MPRSLLSLTDFQGWVPAYDPRRLGSVSVMSGQNFFHGTDGPFAAFGSALSDYNRINPDVRSQITELRVNDQFFYGTSKGVVRLNPVNKQLEVILEVDVDEADKFWPWSIAFVGGVYYFAQFNIGLWQYDHLTNTVTQIDTPVGMNIRFICASYDRVICLSDTLYFWSGLDDGTDYVPSLDTGAGAQALSIIGRNPFRVDPLPDGFLVSTGDGIVRATAVSADYVWQHSVISRDIRIFSPNAGAVIPDIGYVCLDRGGFHLIAPGALPEVWQGDMSAFVKDNPIALMDKTKYGCLGMYFSHAFRSLFVYFASNFRQGEFAQTLVWCMPSGKWGSFDRSHFGFFETYFGKDNDDTCAYLGLDYHIHALTTNPFVEILPDGGFCLLDFLLRETVDMIGMANVSAFGVALPVTNQKDTNPPVRTTIILLRGEIMTADSDPALRLQRDGVLLTNPFNPSTPYYLQQAGLNSQIDIGPFTVSDKDLRTKLISDADATCSIAQIVVGTSKGDAPTIVDDFHDDTGAEDYGNDTSDPLDLGTGFVVDNFTAELSSSDDGIADPFYGVEPLLFSETVGSTIQIFPGGNSAIYHRLRLKATDAGEKFAIKTLSVSVQPTGRRF